MADLLLITGGAGFIGSHTVRAALALGLQVRVLDNFSTSRPGALDGLSVEVLEGDIRSDQDVQRAFEGVDLCVHLAARISVPESCDDPVGYDEVNAVGTTRVFRAARDGRCRRVVFASSAAVYGSDPSVPKTLAHAVQPESPYAAQKLANEHMARALSASGALQTVGLRYFNVFGPGQDANGPYGAVIPKFVEAAVAGRPLDIHGDGLQSRDFVSVRDVARANLVALRAEDVSGRVFNVGTERGLTVLELARLVVERAPGTVEVRHGPERAGDVRHSVSDISATVADLGWRPEADFEAALAETVEYFLGREA